MNIGNKIKALRLKTSTTQKIHRIENMLDYENELTDEQFRNTEEFLMEIKDTYDENHPNHHTLLDLRKIFIEKR